MQPMWFGKEPTVEGWCAWTLWTVVRHRAPYYGRVVVRHEPCFGYRAPIVVDRITDIALPITAVRSSADRITDGPSSAAGLTGLSSADVSGKRRRLLIGRGRGSGQNRDHSPEG